MTGRVQEQRILRMYLGQDIMEADCSKGVWGYILRNTFKLKIVKHWSRLPGETAVFPSFGGF